MANTDKAKTEATKRSGGSKATTKKTEAETTTKGDSTMTTKTNAKTKNNGNGSRAVKLADMKVIELTKEAFDALSPEDLVAKMIDPANPDINRISRERAKALLVKRIKEGKIKITDAKILMHLTFNSVRVNGVETNGFGFSEANAKVKLTKKAFGELTPVQIAAHVEKYTHKRRVADSIFPAYIKAGMPVTAEDVVYLTCGRVAIEGVTIQTASKKQPVPTTGVQFD